MLGLFQLPAAIKKLWHLLLENCTERDASTWKGNVFLATEAKKTTKNTAKSICKKLAHCSEVKTTL